MDDQDKGTYLPAEPTDALLEAIMGTPWAYCGNGTRESAQRRYQELLRIAKGGKSPYPPFKPRAPFYQDGKCTREGGCVCGGNTPAQRATCMSWVADVVPARPEFVNIDQIADEDITLNRLRRMARDYDAKFGVQALNFEVMVDHAQIKLVEALPGHVLAQQFIQCGIHRMLGREMNLNDVAWCERFMFVKREEE